MTSSVDVSAPTQEAWEAIRGGYDTQVHVGPDVIRRRYDDVDLAREFLDAGLAGFVLKSHYFPTGERAHVVRRAVPGIEAYGAVTLNHGVGGMNPVAVDLAGRSGASVVWFPTVDALNEVNILESDMPNPPAWAGIKREMLERGIDPRRPLSVVDDSGAMRPEVSDCLKAASEHSMIVASGHLGREEIFTLVRGAKSLGVERVVVTHAEFPSENFSAQEQKELVEAGALIEHCFTTAYTKKCTWEDMFANIAAVSPQKCVISTDLGQPANPPVSEGLAIFAQLLLNAGFSASDVRCMAVDNPGRLLQH